MEQRNNFTDIPGFYFDKEKKKYYKILPNQNASSSSCILTRQKIEEQLCEEKRLKDISKYDKWVHGNHFSSRKCHTSILSSLETVRAGQLPPHRLLDEVCFASIGHWTLQGSVKIEKTFNHTESNLQQMVAIRTLQGMNLLQRWQDDGDDSLQSISICELKDCFKSKQRHLKRHVKPSLVTTIPVGTRDVSLCPTDVLGFQPDHLVVCIAASSYKESILTVRCMENNSFNHTCPMSIAVSLGQETVWCSASNNDWFSVGCENHAFILRWDSFSRQSCYKLKGFQSCVHCQVFDTGNSNLLYSGTKKGMVFMNDVRVNNRGSQYCLNQKACLLHLLQPSDSNFLLASDSTGKIKLWDLRCRRILQTYDSTPQYIRLPFHLDNKDMFLYAAGQDGYTRIWNFRNSKLLNTIPPPVQVSKQSLPFVHLLEPGTENNSVPRLIMAIKTELFFY